MIPRLYLEAPLGEGAAVTLSSEQAHYLRNVLRRAVGDEIRVFNARDGEFRATLAEIGKKSSTATVDERRRLPQAEPDIQLLFSPVKRAPTELIVQKTTELGVSRLTPVLTGHTNAERLRTDRLSLIAREAAEQCDRLSVPLVDEPQRLLTLLDGWDASRKIIYCDEAGDDPAEDWGGCKGRAAPLLDAVAGAASERWAILIGPEGGFAADERQHLRSLPFVVPVTLGPRILRADTAAIAALTLLQAAVGDFRRP